MEFENNNIELIIGLGIIYVIIRLLTMFYIKNNGHDISLFSPRIRDLNLIFEVSKKYKSRLLRILHFFHYLFMLIFPIVLIIIFFRSGPSNNFYTCRIIEHFKEKEYSGIIVDKYIDTKQHATKTVLLQHADSNFKIYGFNQLNEDNFNEIQKGDSIFKKTGEKFIIMKRDSTYKKFYLTIDCDYEKYKEELNKY